MPLYDVTITATITKVIRVDAADEEDASIEAEEKFCPLPGRGEEERYSQCVSNCVELKQ